ncbi:hypothetical protein [Kordia antarctica]|uniref:hypothetical protein n=1 Tax=Kordia antarctica TaxID=1218801 RepID=UPI00135C35EE|nr:hypothetical protein [Kordia antarctica]
MIEIAGVSWMKKLEKMSDSLITTLIAGGTGLISSLITIYWLKPKIDRKFHIFQLEENYKHEQAKKIKEIIGQYKSQLLNSAEHLHSRLKNYSKNCSENWLEVNGDYHTNHYYIDTMVYRFLNFFAYIKLVEDNLEYLDTTNSENDDMEMIRYFRIFADVISDVDLFKGSDYDANNQSDHIFRNRFEQYYECLIQEKKIISFNLFEDRKDELIEYIQPIYMFFDGMNKTEPRYRLERLKCFHCILISFLNHFGYDFQETKLTKVQKLKKLLGPLKFESGLKIIIKKYKLKGSKQLTELVIDNYK